MPTSEDLNDWLRALAEQQDRQAFAALFKHFAPRVKAYVMRLGCSPNIAEELAQDTMLNVWRRAATFDPLRAGASTWVFTIARNLRVDHLRRHGESMFQNPASDSGDDAAEAERLPDPAPPLDEQLGSKNSDQRVRDALARLTPEQAHILRLSFFEEHAHSKIAQDLGLPLGTVKSRIRYAVQHLRRLMNVGES